MTAQCDAVLAACARICCAVLERNGEVFFFRFGQSNVHEALKRIEAGFRNAGVIGVSEDGSILLAAEPGKEEIVRAARMDFLVLVTAQQLAGSKQAETEWLRRLYDLPSSEGTA